jgi:hypothetical protein
MSINHPSETAEAKSYSSEWLQIHRPQPMYDKNINRLYKKIFYENPADDLELVSKFKSTFLDWLKKDNLNKISGFYEGFETDICIGCTQFIDDLYQTEGAEKIMIFSGDYRYHWRLNNNIQYYSVESLTPGFPSIGDVHPRMGEILDRCHTLRIPVHIDGAWISCSRDLQFDFSHPAIQSFAISLSKGLGLGGNRVALRFTRRRKPGPITIMNEFNMNCQSLLHVGMIFMNELGSGYFWKKYGDSYEKVCRDFNLKGTKAIHLAQSENGPVGVRLLLRYLNDK